MDGLCWMSSLFDVRRRLSDERVGGGGMTGVVEVAVIAVFGV